MIIIWPQVWARHVCVSSSSLVQLASMAENLERGGPVQHNFTLADLISNVAEVILSSLNSVHVFGVDFSTA